MCSPLRVCVARVCAGDREREDRGGEEEEGGGSRGVIELQCEGGGCGYGGYGGYGGGQVLRYWRRDKALL